MENSKILYENCGEHPSSPTINNPDADNEKLLIEQWKRMLDFAENNSERRIKNNNVYLSINTLLLGGTTYLSGVQNQFPAICGIFISILWFISIATYRTTNKVRYEVIRNIEKNMEYSPITDEYKKLEKNFLYFGNCVIEMLIPIVFFVIFFVCLFCPVASSS